MKTASIITSLSRKGGGLFESVRRLHQTLAEIPGVDVRVLGLKDKFTDLDLPAWAPLVVEAYDLVGSEQFAYSPDLRRRLLSLDEDIIHTHGIWEYPSAAVSEWHQTFRRPYLVSPHGMLDPWAVRNSAWKKRLAWTFYERKHLENAACIRALCQSEAESIRTFGLKNPICIIPNGIDLPSLQDLSSGARGSAFEPLAQGRKVLLYLGRLHPKKGLVNLLRAWRQVLDEQPLAASSWVLAIAGWDQGGHERELKKLSAEFGIENSVHFLGPKFDEEKVACYRDCAAFILPSFSEGLPMVILEAWAHAKPVVMTPECNLPEGFDAQAAVRIGYEVAGIAGGLKQLFEMPAADLEAMGKRGLALVQDRFVWPKIVAEMKDVYDWVLGGGPMPSNQPYL